MAVADAVPSANIAILQAISTAIPALAPAITQISTDNKYKPLTVSAVLPAARSVAIKSAVFYATESSGLPEGTLSTRPPSSSLPPPTSEPHSGGNHDDHGSHGEHHHHGGHHYEKPDKD
jgi:hypothetical protein